MEFYGLCGFLLACSPPPCLLHIFYWGFYFFKVHSPTHSIYALLYSRPILLGTAWVCGAIFVLPLPWYTCHFLLVCPWCYLVSILSYSLDRGASLESPLIFLWDFLVAIDGSFLGFIQRTCLAHSLEPSDTLSCFLIWVILFSWSFWWSCEPLGYILIVWDRSCFVTLFAIFQLEELIGLIKVITELGMIDVPTIDIDISYDLRNFSVGFNSCQNPALLLFV